MSLHFHPLIIKKVNKETTDCISVCFDTTQNPEFLTFKEGQNIAIKKIINGEELRRSYSICSAPHEKELKIAIKQVDGGLFSTYANNELKQNDILDVMLPSGKFNAHISGHDHYLAVAAGSGITPIISIIKHTLHSRPESTFTLLYGSKNRASIIFFEELENLKNKYMERFTLINILSREKTDTEINHGRINEEKLHQLNKIIDYKKINSAYLCGPESMIFSAASFLKTSGIAKNNIHYELFTTPGQYLNKNIAKINIEDSSSPKSNVTIKVDGRSFSFDLSFKGNSILDEALQQGADLPFACKGGVCCTCRAKLLEGNVSMDVNYALEQEEVEQGFILTCQSHPISNKVVIDFDVK